MGLGLETSSAEGSEDADQTYGNVSSVPLGIL